MSYISEILPNEFYMMKNPNRDKHINAYDLRLSGMTFPDIAKKFGISLGGARHCVRQGKLHVNQREKWEMAKSLCMNFTDLVGLVRHGISEAARAGIQPSEVWIGPKEAHVLDRGDMWIGPKEAHVLDRGDMEGAQLMGLRVRLMSKDGVRVGISWPNEKGNLTH